MYFSSSSRPTGVNLKYSGAGKDCCLKEAKAASIAASDDLDLGERHKSIIALAIGILASGNPTVLAA